MNMIERKPRLDSGEQSERDRSCDWRNLGDQHYLCVGLVEARMQLNKDVLPKPHKDDHFIKTAPSLLVTLE